MDRIRSSRRGQVRRISDNDLSGFHTEYLMPYGAGFVMVSVSSVTAAVRANTRPSTVAPVVTVMEANARMLPLNTEPVPRVAELPTCQKTLEALRRRSGPPGDRLSW